MSSGARPLVVARSFSFLAVSGVTCTSMRLLYGFRPRPASTQAACRTVSTRLSQATTWFQMAKIGDAIPSGLIPATSRRGHRAAASRRLRGAVPPLRQGAEAGAVAPYIGGNRRRAPTQPCEPCRQAATRTLLRVRVRTYLARPVGDAKKRWSPEGQPVPR